MLYYNSLQLDTPLKRLPPEIIRQLLSVLELSDLRAMVFTSRFIYGHYEHNRMYLLRGSLETTLGSVTDDAYAVYLSSSKDFDLSRTRKTIRQFQKSYQEQLSWSKQHWHRAKTLTDIEVISMVKFHYTIIKFARPYLEWAMNNLADETGGSPCHETLSKTEKKRLMRGIYRFQLLCNLFNPDVMETYPGLGLETFLCIFEPWEIEEITCFYAFAEEKFRLVFRAIRWDVHQHNPQFDDQPLPPTPDGAFDLTEFFDYRIEGTITHGLELLHAVLFEIRDHRHLVSKMQEHIRLQVGNFLMHILHNDLRINPRRGQLSDRDRKQQQGELFPFKGESDPVTGELLPPLAWTEMWRGTYSSLYGFYVPNTIRRWGYVLWDAARLERTGAKAVLTRQFEARWDDDPRGSPRYYSWRASTSDVTSSDTD
ncbi:hypothetical protein QQS21_000805 [Conoideocrella luteorostrata]|uniref:F-box domain-containing protein n=1 Tax=Conoideocrella luteorostrata TaxID=1105319 RepID=A0AAJ0CY93_9HYPO|nr:hypothetical protein QQS21_000805 [Conoideocrella luteorostrata]